MALLGFLWHCVLGLQSDRMNINLRSKQTWKREREREREREKKE